MERHVSIRGVSLDLTVIEDPASVDLDPEVDNAVFIGTDERGNLIEGVWS